MVNNKYINPFTVKIFQRTCNIVPKMPVTNKLSTTHSLNYTLNCLLYAKEYHNSIKFGLPQTTRSLCTFKVQKRFKRL